MRLHEYFEQRLHTQPEKIAVRFGGKDYAYRKLAGRSTRIAARLSGEWGVAAGDRVAYLGSNHLDCITLLAGCGTVGALYLPLNYRLAAAELSTILQDAQPRVLVADAQHAALAQQLAQQINCAVRDVDELVAQPCVHPAPHAPVQNNDVLLVYTSGTTGRTKGVVHTLDAMAANIRASIKGQGIGADDVVLSALPLFHVGGLCIQTLPALAAGATVLLHARFDAGAWLAAVQAHRPTQALMVPATLRAVIAHAAWLQTDLSSLKAICAGSSTIPAALIDAVHARGVPLTQVYGSTETGPTSTVLPAHDAVPKAGSAGAAAPGVELCVRAPDAQGIGEVLVRGPNLMRGYFKHELNNSPTGLDADGWFATGDLGRIDSDGALWIAGRAKDMLISGGENIYPAELENVLASVPQIAEAAVIGLPDPRWGEVPVACIVARADALLDEAAVLAAFEGKLARFKHPKRIVFLQELPKNAMGKVEKARLLTVVTQILVPQTSS
ncbi:MAG: Acyl-CoA synthetase (AMP-forming)/AMP-acid ligase [Pseudomonadota bacterium]|jgi:fatty-acyl-CoA synthase